MKLTTLILLVVLTSLAATNAFNTLIPKNKKLIYSWVAQIKAGFNLPIPYASQVTITAKIHLQSNDSSAFVQIRDLYCRTYYGLFDNVSELYSRLSPISYQAKDLENVFRIIYDKTGKVRGIATEKNETEFSRNIKRGIATTFHLSNSVFDEENADTFTVKEKSIYRDSTYSYQIFPLRQNLLEVRKTHEESNAQNLNFRSINNLESIICNNEEKSLPHNNYKIYSLEKGKFWLAKMIKALQSVSYNPFKTEANTQEILVNQTFQLLDVVPIQEQYRIKSEEFDPNLNYRDESIQDETNQVILAQNCLKEIHEYLHNFNIQIELVISKYQMINRVQQLLMKFNYEKLEDLEKLLTEDTLKILYQILPFVGTEASTLRIKTLIIQKSVDEETAITLLQQMAEIVNPSIDLLIKLEDFLHLDHGWNVQKAAVLSFGTLIHKSYTYHKKNNNQDYEKPYQKYVEEYLQKARHSESYSSQIVYLMGLRNMKLPMIAALLVPAFKGEWCQDPHFRYMALWAAGPSLLQNSGSIDLFSIVSDHQQPADLRSLSLHYMIRSNSDISSIKNLSSLLLKDSEQELYRYYYQLIKVETESPIPCQCELKEELKSFLKTIPKTRGSSKVKLLGYQNDHYGFGRGTQSFFFKTNESRLYQFEEYSQRIDKYTEEYGFYLKIYDGQNHNPGPVQTIIDILAGKSGTDFLIEAAIIRRGQIINVYTFDITNINQLPLLDEVLNPFKSFSKNFFYLYYQKYQSVLIPTDLGIPLKFEYLMPDALSFNISVLKEMVEGNINAHFEVVYFNSIHYLYGLSFYNPVGGIWHGAKRYHFYDLVVPLQFDVKVNFEESTLKISWKKQVDAKVAGVKSYVLKIVFKQNELIKIIPNEAYDYVIKEETIPDVGYNISTNLNDFKELKHFDSTNRWIDSNFDLILSYLYQFQDLVLLLPEAGTHRMSIEAKPIDEISRSIDLTQRYNLSANYSHHLGDFQITYMVTKQNSIVKIWNLNFTVYCNSSYQSFGLEATRTIPNQKDFKMCVEGRKEWKWKRVEGYFVVNMGESDDDKCVKDSTFEITSKGEFSAEQNSSWLVQCKQSDVQLQNCSLTYDTLRFYTYDLNLKKASKELKQQLKSLLSELIDYLPHTELSKSGDVSQDFYKVTILHPLTTCDIDVIIKTNRESYEFSKVPEWYLDCLEFVPDDGLYPEEISNKYKNGEIDVCTVYPYGLSFNLKDLKKEVVPNKWILYFKNNSSSIYLKRLDNNLAIKATVPGHVLEVYPVGASYNIRLDGAEVPSEQRVEKWISFNFVDSETGFSGFLEEEGISFGHSDEYVTLAAPRGGQRVGRCYN